MEPIGALIRRQPCSPPPEPVPLYPLKTTQIFVNQYFNDCRLPPLVKSTTFAPLK